MPESVASKSESSIGSAVDDGGGSKSHQDGLGADEAVTSTMESGLFGVLFVEKAPGKTFVGFRIFMDWIQVFLLVVNPAYGWNIDRTSKAWQLFSFIQLNEFMSSRGYTFFLACMYILAIALAFNLALCVWVSNSFKTNNFQHVWPIVVLRYFSLVFYQVLDIASLTLFLMTMDCQYFSVPPENLGRHAEFPNIMCWTMPHMIHVFVAALSIAVFFVLATLFVMAEIELNPVSRNLIGMAHTKAEVCGFAIRMAMTCVGVFVTGLRWMSVIQLVGASLLVYFYLRWLPHLHAVVNHVRVASYCSILWAAGLLVILVMEIGINPDDPEEVNRYQANLTIALWAGVAPAALAGALCSWMRTNFYLVTVVNKFRDAPLDEKPQYIHVFTDPRQVEMASRCCRVWVGKDVLDEDNVQVAERIIRAGMSMLPHHPYMAIWWSSFLIDVKNSYQSGYVALQTAKKMPNHSFLERFCIFIREQEHTQKASAASSGENASADLVSYVEFQRNYRLVLRLHGDALNAKRMFWETLLHNEVKFDTLAMTITRVDQTVREADRMYQQVLSRHSGSVKLLQLYVKFLQHVRNDPWSAARWGAEAEKLQKAEEESNERAVLGEGHGDQRKIQGFDETKGIVIMCANCLIRMVNDSAASMFGYSQKAELVGKNVNVLVPPPFNRNHNNYVRTYIETGTSKMLDNVIEVVATHKDRYVIPVKIFVTKVSGIGEDSVFMGVFQALPIDTTSATVWLLAGGQILSCDSLFTDWLGYKQEDIHLKPMRDLLTHTKDMDELMVNMKKWSAAPKPTHMRRSSVGYGHVPNSPSPTHMGPDTTLALPQWSVTGKMLGDPSVRGGGSLTAGQGGGIQQMGGKCWMLPGLQLKHSFLEGTVVKASATVLISGMVDTPLLVCKLTRDTKHDEGKADQLLVTDSKGRVTHVTSHLAARLGSTASKICGAGMLHALDALLPAPFVALHHQWARVKPTAAPPPWSCRSGLSMCLNAVGPDGPIIVPFSLDIKTKATGHDVTSVVRMEERTQDQMLDERRLLLMVDSKGMITEVSASPYSLFDMDPLALVGNPLAHIVDILRPDMAADMDLSAVLDHEQAATKTIMHMAQRSYDNPGMSWRCGVSAIIDPIELQALGPMGRAMIAKETVPSVLLVQPYLERTGRAGAKAVLAKEMRLQVELWRTDLLCGVLELDSRGNMTEGEMAKKQPAYSPHLLLGMPINLFKGAALSTLLNAFKGDHSGMVDALFTEGGLTIKAIGSGSIKAAPAMTKGGLRGASSRKREVGPLHNVKVRHGTDGQELELQLQAVVKQGSGSSSSLYLILHALRPVTGRIDFATWVWNAPEPTLLPLVRRVTSSKLHDVVQSAMSVLQKEGGDSKRKQNPPKDVKSRMRFDDEPEIPGLIKTAESAALLDKPDDAHLLMGHDADGASDAGSVGPGLKDESRQRIATWITTAGDNGASMDKVEDDDLGSFEADDEEEEQEPGATRQSMHNPAAMALADDDDQGGDLDEAGGVNDYKRGKRLKKLVKLLGSPQASASLRRFRVIAMVVVAVLMITDLCMFVTFMMLVNTQTAQVLSLRQAARAGSRVMQTALLTCSVELLISSHFPMDPNMRYLGSKPKIEDVQSNLDLMAERVKDLDELHHGIYRGFGKARQLPMAYGLRDLWDNPTLESLKFYKKDTGATNSKAVNASLWTVGNAYVLAAKNLMHNVLNFYPPSDEELRYELANDTDLLYILYNGPRTLVDSYSATLDGLMQKAVDDSASVNNVQLVVLGVEGCLVAAVAFIVIWIITTKVVQQRYRVFCVFLRVPVGIIKSEATRALNLVEGGDEDDGNDNGLGDPEQGTGMATLTGPEATTVAPVQQEVNYGPRRISAPGGSSGFKLFNTSAGKAQGAGGYQGRSFCECLLACITCRNSPPRKQEKEAKRRLNKSRSAVIKVAWPFLFWAVFVVVINALGWQSLATVSAPIAISNIVQFVSIRMNKVLLLSQRLVSQQYLEPLAGYTSISDFPGPALDILKDSYRVQLEQEFRLLLIEYDAMMYGRAAPSVANNTSPHFQLASEGIMFSEGAKFMFEYSGCLAENPVNCLTDQSEFYQSVTNGLDQAIKGLFFHIEALLQLPNEETKVDCLPFDYIYEVGNFDIVGSLEKLIDVYSNHVRTVYQQALVLHIVALVVCCAMGLFFIVVVLLPQCKMVSNESRRVAELLSHLPPEVDVEGMVSEALQTSPSPIQHLPPGSAGAAGALALSSHAPSMRLASKSAI